MSVELAAAYERIEEMQTVLRMLWDMIESDDFGEGRDIALDAIEDQLANHKVRV